MADLEGNKGQDIDLRSLNAKTSTFYTEDIGLSAKLELDSIDPVARAKVVRQFDLRVVPFGIIAYLVAFIDRSNAGNAKILGMVKDLDLTGYRFNIAMSAFFVTYIVLEVPSSLCCRKYGPKRWIPFIVFSFGLISMCIGFAKNYATFVGLRVLLGAAEAGIMPGIAYMLSTFYRRNELATRIGVYASCASLSGAFGGVLATGLSKIPKWGIMHTWRNIFFFEGIITMIVGVVVYIFIPASPGEAHFLTPEERKLAARIIELETLSAGHNKIKWVHVRNSISISNAILVVTGFMSLMTMNSMSLFVPTILNNMGYSSIRSQLMSVPPYAFGAIVCVAVSVWSDKWKRYGIPMLCLIPFGVVGFALLFSVRTVGVKYFALFLALPPAFTLSPMVVSWSLTNSAPATVRAISGAYQAGLGSVGAILATWTYLTKDSPDFKQGHAINLGGYCIALVAISILTLYYRWENKVRDRGGRDDRLINKTQTEVEDLGHKHPSFRYTP